MNQFITALLGDLSYVGEHWEDVYNEYVSLRENKQSSYILDLMKEITYLNAKVFIISKCVEVLALQYSRELVMELKQCGCKGTFDYSDKAQYSADLRASVSYAKKYKNQAEKKNDDLTAYQKLHGGETVNRKSFDIWAVTLGKWMGFRIDYDVVTVTEYCHMMNQYEKYCEVSHAQDNNMIKR